MSQQCFLDWDNARVHTAAVVSSCFDAHGVPRLEHAPYGVAIPLIAVAFAAAFKSVVARCKKRVCLGGKFVEKS